jgi:hypothetical protein
LRAARVVTRKAPDRFVFPFRSKKWYKIAGMSALPR